MARCCWIDVAARAAQWKHVWVETGLVDEVLEEKVGTIRRRHHSITENLWALKRREDALLERPNSIVASVVRVVRSHFFGGSRGTTAFVMVKVVRLVEVPS
jgi:hypothetical protein